MLSFTPFGNPRLEGPCLLSIMPIRRQLAPTVGPKALGVTFEAGTLGGIGESIAVGHAVNIDGNVYINCDNTFMPANDYIVGCGIVPVGGIDIFIGYTRGVRDAANSFAHPPP